MAAVWMFLLVLPLLQDFAAARNEPVPEGPSFTTEPPHLIEFSNSTGGHARCSARGFPKPTINWVLGDDSPAINVEGVRQVHADGTLVFPPFRAEEYRPDVHTSIYRCLASNSVGTIATSDIQVKGAVTQNYDVYVYDVYAIRGNTAVMKCHIPSILSNFITVTSWIRDSVVIISPSHFDPHSKYSLLPNGELHIKNVDMNDGMTSFRCQTTHRLTGEVKNSITSGKLFVTEPQGNVPSRITSTNKYVMADQGSDALLPCVVQGNPPPKVLWKKKSKSSSPILVTGSRFIQIAESLVIRDVSEADSGNYICSASNIVGNDAIEVTLSVATPLSASIDPSSVQVDVGNSVQFTCKTSGSPIKSTRWFKDGKELNLDGIQLKENKTLSIPVVSPTHRGIYQCFVNNEKNVAYGKTTLILGDIIPSIISTFQEAVLQPGSIISIQCIANGSPTPKVSWALDDMDLSNNGRTSWRETVDDQGQVTSSLTIKSIKYEDGGVYKCSAKNKAGSAEYCSRINVYGKLSMRPRPKVIAVSEQKINLHCPFYGYPVSSITWEKGGISLPEEERQRVFPNGTLQINMVQRVFDSGKYTCTVFSPEGQSVAGTVDLTVMVPPKIVPFSFQEELVREGMRGRLQCVIVEGDLPLSIRWTKDGKIPQSSLGITIRNIDEFSSILTINAISPRHNGNYTCIAENAAAIVRHTTALSVNVAPKIIPFSFQDKNVVEGVLARISCVVYQGDLPIQIVWLKDNQPMEDTSDVMIRIIDEYSSILTIEKVGVKHSGNYTCVATNTAATVSHTAELIVNVPPKIVPFTFQDDSLIEGMLVRVSCVVSRGDLPLSITWLKDGQPIPPALSVTIRDFDEYSSVLSIDPVTAKHNGNYTCISSNHAGTVHHTAPLNVQVRPKWIIQPKDTTIKSGDDAIIHCQADGLPKPSITWKKIEGTNRDGERINVEMIPNVRVFSNGTLTIRKVHRMHEGYYFCSASNGVHSDLSKAIFLSINAPPNLHRYNPNVIGKKGENVTLSCLATGDFPFEFTWSTDNNLISPMKERRFEIHTGNDTKTNGSLSELIIKWVSKKDTKMYKCTVKNPFGEEEMEISLTIQEQPDTPAIDTPVVINRSVEIHWKEPFDGNSPLKRYVLQYKKKIDNWQSKSTNISTDGVINFANVSNLQAATTYNFRVLAENEIGQSEFSNTVTVTTDEDAPSGPPQNVEVESTDPHTLRITWKPPKKNLWNGALRGYNIGYKVHGSNESYIYTSMEVPEDYVEDLIYQIPDLKMYTQYSIIVLAYNKKGKGPASEEILTMTSEDVPSSPPVGLRCSTLSSKSIYVIWDPPDQETVNGILRGYKVLYKSVKELYESELHSKAVQVSKATLQNLEVSSNYSIQVLAFTKVGDGKRSNAIFCKTHEDVPEAPGSVKVIPSSSDSVTVAWKHPIKTNGVITKYNIYYKPLEDGTDLQFIGDSIITEELSKDANVQSLEPQSDSYEIRGLKKNRKYAFWVTAASMIGEGPSSQILAETVAESVVPARSVSFNDVIKTSWKRDVVLPCKAVGVPTPQRKWMTRENLIQPNDRVFVRTDGALMITKTASEDTGNYTCAIYNEHGKDEVNYAVTVQVPPSAPVLDVVSKSRTSIQLQWKPNSDGGDKIRGYILHYRRELNTWETREILSDQEVLTLESLACGANYQVYMEAFNSIGTGVPTDILTITTEGSDVTAPNKEDLIREGTTFMTILLESWPTAGCPVTHFTVEYRDTKSREWKSASDNIKPSQRKLVIPNLVPATWYALRLTAHTGGGSMVNEYKFATHTTSGGTISPDMVEEDLEPVYAFYLDPFVFIPTVALFIVLIISSIVVCLYMRRRSGSIGAPSEAGSSIFNTWTRSSRRSSRTSSDIYAQIIRRSGFGRRRNREPSPYATSSVSGCMRESKNRASSSNSGAPPPPPPLWSNQSNAQKPSFPPTPTAPPEIPFPGARCDPFQSNIPPFYPGVQETTFVFPPGVNYPGFSTPVKGCKPDDGYDPPPLAHMKRSHEDKGEATRLLLGRN